MTDSITQDEYLDRFVATAPTVGPINRAALRTLLRPGASADAVNAVAARHVPTVGERRRTGRKAATRAA